jgi:hypothetical protein
LSEAYVRRGDGDAGPSKHFDLQHYRRVLSKRKLPGAIQSVVKLPRLKEVRERRKGILVAQHDAGRVLFDHGHVPSGWRTEIVVRGSSNILHGCGKKVNRELRAGLQLLAEALGPQPGEEHLLFELRPRGDKHRVTRLVPFDTRRAGDVGRLTCVAPA